MQLSWWLGPFVDDKTGTLSNAKISVIVCFTVCTYKFLQIPADFLSVDMLLAYGALGGLHNALILLIKRKYPDVANDSGDDKKSS